MKNLHCTAFVSLKVVCLVSAEYRVAENTKPNGSPHLMHISHHSTHLAQRVLLPRPFTPDLKLLCFTIPSPIVLLISSGLPSQSQILNLDGGPDQVGTGVCSFQFLLFVFFVTCAID